MTDLSALSDLDLLAGDASKPEIDGCGPGCLGAVVLVVVGIGAEFLPLFSPPQWVWWVVWTILGVAALLTAWGGLVGNRQERVIKRYWDERTTELDRRLVGEEVVLVYQSVALPHGGHWWALLRRGANDLQVRVRRSSQDTDVRTQAVPPLLRMIDDVLGADALSDPPARPVIDGFSATLRIQRRGRPPVSARVNFAGLSEREHPVARLLLLFQSECQRLTQSTANWGTTDPYGNIHIQQDP